MPGAVGLAYLLTGDRREAAEMAEEAFVRAAGRFAHRLARDRFPALLRRHLVRIFLSGARRNGRAPELDRAGSDAREHGTWEAVLSLPARERVAVVLRYCQGVSEEEVARALRCSVPDARSTLSSGIEMLDGAKPPDPPPMP